MSEKDLNESFLKYCEKIKKVQNLDNIVLLALYGHYKQATCGDCDIDEPYKIYYKEHAKYTAWFENKNISKEKAMASYIKLVKKSLKDV